LGSWAHASHASSSEAFKNETDRANENEASRGHQEVHPAIEHKHHTEYYLSHNILVIIGPKVIQMSRNSFYKNIVE
jgi:hypothetical protein